VTEGSRTVNVLLGDEYDHALIARAQAALKAMGGELISRHGYLAGSQEVGVQTWSLDGSVLTLETETYMGFSVEGPEPLVTALTLRLAQS
jgi:hypothetical protein